MTATVKKTSRRYSREQRQENRSRHQFCERLDEVGWIPSTVETDMGEDLLVRIYDDGVSTGLSFYVQLKSSADSAALKRKRSAALAYPLEVKDLLHWKRSATLVVLVVWDVATRAGWWRPIPEIIKELNKTNKSWREKKTVAVSVPLENGTDENGLMRLRWTVADHSLPVVPKPKRMKISLVFERTEEQLAALQGFQRAVDLGEPLLLEGGFAPKIKFPEWYRRLYGHAPVIQLSKFEKGNSSPSKKILVVRVEVDSSEGHAEYAYVELRPVIQGRKRILLTNEHQSLPLVFEFDLYEKKPVFRFRQERSGRTVYEARDAAAFFVEAMTPGAIIRVIIHGNGHLMMSFPSPRMSSGYGLEGMRRWREMLDKMCRVQQQIARVGTLSIGDEDAVSVEDVRIAERLLDICRFGKVELQRVISFDVLSDAEELPSENSEVQMELQGARVKLLNLVVPLGAIRVTVIDSERFLDAVRRARSEAIATQKPVPVLLEDVRVVEEYLDWLPQKPPWDAVYESIKRLLANVTHYDGYFARADAREAGASEMAFEAILREQKVEPVASEVFRLAHFPRSDHEELISLWLQTDRKGVISHDTALLLHELSDVLPRRRHITVPPGWDPVDRQLDANVVLHHAEVGEDEIRWLGPVPYTAPLRTLRDCIASHLSPDLIEQAITEGLQRGMFTEAELPPGARRGAA